MKTQSVLSLMLLAFIMCQSCATTSTKRSVVKKKKVQAKPLVESYALMEDWEKVDKELLKRGNRARGLSEY
jgi:PBP1b-binding outer membrane lipoprotein LpoB